MNLIPKRIYFYWGGKSLPFLRYMTILSFRKYNPDWKIILCQPTSENLSQNYNWPGKENKNDLSSIPNYFDKLQGIVDEFRTVDMTSFGLPNNLPEVTKSDFYRLNLLANECGVWMDMDIIFFHPLEYAFLKTDHRVYICYQPNLPGTPPYHSIGLLMSAPYNDSWKNLLFYAKQHIMDYDYQAIGSPFYKKYLDETAFEVCNFSNNIVYPIRWPDKIWHRPAEVSLQELKPETIGIHHYAGHFITAEFQAKLTHENYMNYDNIVCYFIKKALNG